MNQHLFQRRALALFASALASVLSLEAQSPMPSVPVKMTVTLNVMGENKRMPLVNREDVMVKQGKDRMKATEWVPARGDRAGLDLFILIDDACDTSLGVQLNDLRAFINAQPETASIGVGYMQNARVLVAQDFTTDHAAAAKALRLPLGSPGAFGSPYRSAIDLMKRWPESPNRREIIMITDGIDRSHGGPRHFLSINPDVDLASTVAQRTGTIIYTVYSPGAGRLSRNFWEATNGQNGISKLSDETGGESYFLGRLPAVSFEPYLNQIARNLENQYLLVFEATPRKKAGLQPVALTTEIAGVEFGSADNVWVPLTATPGAGTGTH